LPGSAPAESPRTVAASSTASIRPRTRLAVSGFSAQIGIEHLNNKAGIDCGNGQFPESGADVSGEGIFPLLPVLRVAPADPVPLDELGGALPEGAALCDGKALRLPLGFLGVERVDPVVA
jgi:hypothetical protein